MDGICNGARDSFCETRLHRYTQFHDLETTISNHKELRRSKTNFSFVSLRF